MCLFCQADHHHLRRSDLCIGKKNVSGTEKKCVLLYLIIFLIRPFYLVEVLAQLVLLPTAARGFLWHLVCLNLDWPYDDAVTLYVSGFTKPLVLDNAFALNHNSLELKSNLGNTSNLLRNQRLNFYNTCIPHIDNWTITHFWLTLGLCLYVSKPLESENETPISNLKYLVFFPHSKQYGRNFKVEMSDRFKIPIAFDYSLEVYS